jgi:hypothetical protein
VRNFNPFLDIKIDKYIFSKDEILEKFNLANSTAIPILETTITNEKKIGVSDE